MTDPHHDALTRANIAFPDAPLTPDPPHRFTVAVVAGAVVWGVLLLPWVLL
jgi:hypothetical protein